MAFTKEQIKQINQEMMAALKEVADRHNLSSGASSITYSADTFKLTVNFGDTKATGGLDPKFLENLRRHGWKFGLDEQDLGKTYVSRGKTMKFVGMSGYTNAVIQDNDGKLYTTDAENLCRSIGKTPPGATPTEV